MFSWKNNSEKIFNKILKNMPRTSEYESESEDETLQLSPVSDNGTDNDRCRDSPSSLSEEEIKEKLKKWTDLTNIDMGPYGGGFIRRQNNASPKTSESDDSGSATLSPEIQIHDDEEDEEKVEAELSFKFQFLIISERLKVTLLKASNLHNALDNDSSTEARSVFAKVCLMPGKAKVHTSNAVKQGSSSPNTEFNSVMYFSGIPLHEMHKMSLRITLHERNENNNQTANLGEVTVSLEDFDLTAESTLTELVNTRICSLSRGNGSYRIRLLR